MPTMKVLEMFSWQTTNGVSFAINSISQMIADFQYYLDYASFGGVGGIIYLLLTGKYASVKAVAKAFVTSAFVGLLAGMLAQEVGLSIVLTCVVSGVFGCAGGLGIVWMLALMHKRLGITQEADIKHIKENLIGKEAPETILSGLVAKKNITFDEFIKILEGDTEPLLRELNNGVITGAEFGRVHKWATALRTGESHGDE